MNSVLISDTKCKEIKKQISLIIRRLKDIQQSLLNPECSLSLGLSKVISDLTKHFEDDLYHYRSVTIEHILRSLQKTNSGVLCIKVFTALNRIDNLTPLIIIMRGLLVPRHRWEVEEAAAENATRESKAFMKDIEFLLAVTKKGRITNNLLRKHSGFTIIKENLDQFEAAKVICDQVQEEQKIVKTKI